VAGDGRISATGAGGVSIGAGGGSAANASGAAAAAPGSGVTAAAGGAVGSAAGGAGASAVALGAAGGGAFAGACAQAHNAAANAHRHDDEKRRMRERIDWNADSVLEASGVATQTLAPALYVVATPIGNLADVTLRALWVLSHVDAIAAEDTRQARRLLDRYRIAVPRHGLFAAHEHNERAAAERIAALLREGQRVALVSDAGTPAISDPGARIVRAVRAAGLRVVPVPGAASLAAALSVAGIASGTVHFFGFLPSAPRARERRLAAIAASDAAAVIFEAPHRLRATAAALAARLAPGRGVLIARELTKQFETIDRVAAADLVAYVERHEPRGEYVLVIDAAEEERAVAIDATTRRWLDALAAQLAPARAAAIAAEATGLPRELLYRALTGERKESGHG
jgi:16S rRNA (cytidine1402-2'-O)-methyltransferase